MVSGYTGAPTAAAVAPPRPATPAPARPAAGAAPPGVGQGAGIGGGGSSARAEAPTAEDGEHGPAGQEHQPEHQQADGRRQEPAHLDPEAGLGVHAAAAVRVHDDHGPVAALDLPGQIRGRVGRDLSRPERLVDGWGRHGLAGDAAVPDPVGGDVDVADLIPADALEVAGDVAARADAGEDGLGRVGGAQRQLDGAQATAVDEPVRRPRAGAEVDVVGDDGVGGAGQPDRRASGSTRRRRDGCRSRRVPRPRRRPSRSRRARSVRR